MEIKEVFLMKLHLKVGLGVVFIVFSASEVTTLRRFTNMLIIIITTKAKERMSADVIYVV